MPIRQKSFTAPRCRILLDNKTIGFGTNVSFTVTYEYQDVDVIDNLEVEEFALTAYRVNGSIAKVGTTETSPKTLGMMPQTGIDSEQHLLNALLHGESVLQLVDKYAADEAAKTLHYLYGCVFDSHGFSIAARGLAGDNVTFRCKRHQDFSEA